MIHRKLKNKITYCWNSPLVPRKCPCLVVYEVPNCVHIVLSNTPPCPFSSHIHKIYKGDLQS